MIYRDYLVIGAGIGGASVCEGIRTQDKKGSVMLVGREEFLPYHRPPLSKTFLSNPKMTTEKVLHEDAKWYQRHKIELRLNTSVTQFNIERRLAVLEDGQTVEFRKACLATGSRPRRPDVAGANLGNVFYLNSLRDALAIREIAPSEKGIAIIGGGFIAVETSAALRQAGHKITLVNRNQTIWQKWLDVDTSHWLTEYLAKKGITMMMQEDLKGFEGKTILKNVQTKSGDRFPAGMALVAVGAVPNLDLVLNTPLSSPNGTPVNSYLETDEKGIFAVGDIALYPDPVFGGTRRISHWDNAREQGKIAGSNITGRKRQKFDCLEYFFSDLFDLSFEFVGDFSQPPSNAEIEGNREKKKFIARYFRAGKLMSVVLCGQEPQRAKAARKEIREAHGR